MESIHLNTRPTKDIEEAIRLISGAPATASATNQPGGASSGGAGCVRAAWSRPRLLQVPFSALSVFCPIERINSILVVTPHARYLDQAKQ